MTIEKRSVEAASVLRTPRVDLQHLHFAVTTADFGSFRRSAEMLSIRQSTLSRSVRQLEDYLGVVLFERSSGGVKPTEIGRRFLRTARTILDEFNALIVMARSNQVGGAGRLAIGFCTSLSAGNLRASLLEFKQRYPSIELSTSERSRARLVRMLRNGTVDVLIVTASDSLQDCRSLPLWSERILVMLPREHALSLRESLYWTDLKGETVLLSQYDPGPDIEELLRSKLLSPADRPKVENHDVSRGAMKALVSMRVGVSLILESDLGAVLPSPVYRELRDGTGPSRLSFSAFWRADNESPALDSFLRLLRERYPSPTSVE